MILEDRPWDSQFFGFRISSGFQTGDDDAESLRSFCRAADADCLYLFLDHPLTDGFETVLREEGAFCTDWKTVFTKNDLQYRPADESSIHVPDRIQEDCYRLAVKSGWKSRFHVDEKFRSRQDALYRKWVDTCCPPAENAKVWEYRSVTGELQGMMCAKCQDKIGRLGLISVTPECQGKGIAPLFMQIAENFYLDHGCTVSEAVTQFDNARACGFYRKCGYHITEIKEVWHLWKK